MKEYAHQGIELTPNVFSEVLLLLFDGKQFDRQTAVTEVIKYHTEHGGLANKQNYVQVFKKASQKLKEKGLQNVGFGIWRLSYKENEVQLVEKKEASDIPLFADKELGSGKNAVYVYYYDAYKELAEFKGDNHWPCKIGRTDRDPIQRIFSQAGTCYPENPHIALLLFCDDSSLLETALHGIFKYRGKWLAEAPGTEWFDTSPQEIESYYLLLSQSSVHGETNEYWKKEEFEGAE